MKVLFQHSAAEMRAMDTAAQRAGFLLDSIMAKGELQLVYTHYDRMIVGGAVPSAEPLTLPNPEELKAEYFLQRREMGIINVGGSGTVEADGTTYAIGKLECVYLGKGTQQVSFSSADENNPAVFYLLSAPAHHTYPNTAMTKDAAQPVHLGELATSNKRTIYKYIHDDGIQSCQLVMGLTVLTDGCVWNSVPPHTHTRRMEAYFYFDLHADHRVFHFMGEPQQTRHLIVANHQAVLSPPWSMHFGVGTANYGFIWGMAGENKTFTDMDQVPIAAVL